MLQITKVLFHIYLKNQKNLSETVSDQGKSIVAFGQINEDDVSPKCIDTVLLFDFVKLTCDGRNEKKIYMDQIKLLDKKPI